MKPQRPTEKDLLSLVQSGFNAQLAKDREQPSTPRGFGNASRTGDIPGKEPPFPSSMVRITLTIPEELRFRLKTFLMNQQRRTRQRMTQDEFCAIAIGDLLDFQEDAGDPWSRMEQMDAFLVQCIESRGLVPDWEAKARALLQGFRDHPCARPRMLHSGRPISPPPPFGSTPGDPHP